eukprot:TRINITY_DN6383_c0_g2_i12.p1 TRINITY_DN6383_c0_g2~~TRINITY_DN6383_c0_g2_i12.p1  ORF type:complete len:146 (-),score=32.81 TRINITY_DN6383_c0_g2_i12:131-568(-)
MLSGAPPFYSRDRYQMYKNIIERPVEMKSYFSPEASSLLKGLLSIAPATRLGSSISDAKDIMSHAFFVGINWDDLAQKKIKPPWKPKLQNKMDLRYFDKTFTDEIPRETPVVRVINSNMEDFHGFTYNETSVMDHLREENPQTKG